MKLIDRFMTAPINSPRWKIYDKRTRKKLCDDYGSLRGDSPLDDMHVWSITIQRNRNGIAYYRVSVYTPYMMQERS